MLGGRWGLCVVEGGWVRIQGFIGRLDVSVGLGLGGGWSVVKRGSLGTG